eukprot:CAMPEP_0171998966 /NCGR_PEP_ID=MMETSP1041-20130122/1521_1 /TAXON_ID=464988 /ORGANISM="Hemiselmis andersenii, Strain CCMP439" /LENGTH=337 /DNA_ID=CAMNT_0012652381 /DNA_START=6 /DNA_END=1020 /DNA_ORIENTATION=-
MKMQLSMIALAVILPAAACGVAAGGAMKLSNHPGFGDLCTVGGAAYLNLSLLGCEQLAHVMDLPRCLHEDANSKEKEGWKLSVRDKKTRRKLRAKAKRDAFSSTSGGHSTPRMAFSPPVLPNLRMLSTPVSVAPRTPALVGVSMLLGRKGETAGPSSFPPAGGFGRTAVPSVLLPLAEPHVGVVMAAGKGFGLATTGNSTKNGGVGFEKGQRRRQAAGEGGGDAVHLQQVRDATEQEVHADGNEKGIVVVKCDGCEAKHLIADNIGWYKDWTGEAGGTNIEEIMASKGVSIDNRLRDWDPEDEAAGAVQPLTPDGRPIVMKRREDGTFEAVGEDEEE